MEMYLIPVTIVCVIGVLAGVILAVASKFMAVKVDERVGLLRNELPGANCGACGCAGCDDYASKIVNEPGTPTNLCPVGGAEVAKKLSAIMGVAFEEAAPKYAVVHCSGTCENTSYAIDYKGPKTCAACNSFYNGRGTCPYSCMGFGDCVAACKYDAIHVVDGVAIVDPDACVGCGMCAKACPHHLIELVPSTSKIYVGCSNKQKGGVTRKACKVGCIGCKKCERTCPNGAITVTDNVAHIDPEKCTNCGACLEGCPTKAIRSILAGER